VVERDIVVCVGAEHRWLSTLQPACLFSVSVTRRMFPVICQHVCVCVCVCVCVRVLLQLDGYDLLLQQPDPDVFNWITGKYEVPTELQGSFMDKLLEHVNRNPLDTLRNG
jgi:Flavinator of succinate dehydrogenase